MRVNTKEEVKSVDPNKTLTERPRPKYHSLVHIYQGSQCGAHSNKMISINIKCCYMHKNVSVETCIVIPDTIRVYPSKWF